MRVQLDCKGVVFWLMRVYTPLDSAFVVVKTEEATRILMPPSMLNVTSLHLKFACSTSLFTLVFLFIGQWLTQEGRNVDPCLRIGGSHKLCLPHLYPNF